MMMRVMRVQRLLRALKTRSRGKALRYRGALPLHAKQWEGFSFNFISKRGSCQKSDARAAVAPGTENPQVRQGLTRQRSPSIARKAVGGIFLLISFPSEGAASSLPCSTLPFAASVRHGKERYSLGTSVSQAVSMLPDVPQGDKFGTNH